MTNKRALYTHISEIDHEKYWIMCPVCNGKTRVQIYKNTLLVNFPLFCPKCKFVHIIDVKELKITIKSARR